MKALRLVAVGVAMIAIGTPGPGSAYGADTGYAGADCVVEPPPENIPIPPPAPPWSVNMLSIHCVGSVIESRFIVAGGGLTTFDCAGMFDMPGLVNTQCVDLYIDVQGAPEQCIVDYDSSGRPYQAHCFAVFTGEAVARSWLYEGSMAFDAGDAGSESCSWPQAGLGCATAPHSLTDSVWINLGQAGGWQCMYHAFTASATGTFNLDGQSDSVSAGKTFNAYGRYRLGAQSVGWQDND